MLALGVPKWLLRVASDKNFFLSLDRGKGKFLAVHFSFTFFFFFSKVTFLGKIIFFFSWTKKLSDRLHGQKTWIWIVKSVPGSAAV